METIKIIIVDDDLLARTRLKNFLEKNIANRIIAEAQNGAEVLDLLTNHKPDIVLMDIKMPIPDGFEATIEAMRLFPDLKVIVVAGKDSGKAVEEMIYAGAKGFLTKQVRADELQKAIKTVMNGGTYFSPLISDLYALKTAYVKYKNRLV